MEQLPHVPGLGVLRLLPVPAAAGHEAVAGVETYGSGRWRYSVRQVNSDATIQLRPCQLRHVALDFSWQTATRFRNERCPSNAPGWGKWGVVTVGIDYRSASRYDALASSTA